MTGLVIGKFCPLHLGHDFLITRALAECSETTVVVCGSKTHPYSLEQRLAWVGDAYPQARVLGLDQDAFDYQNEAAWVSALQALLGTMPDCYFTSETNGPRYAELLGTKYQIVDTDRAAFPVSASKINADPEQYAHFLHSVVREEIEGSVATLPS